MPELPEVENVKLTLQALGTQGQTFARVELRRADLRTPLNKSLTRRLPGQKINRIERRAKFLLFETDDFTVINHLGMTGSWRRAEEGADLGKHDHVVFHFRSGLRLVYNDPRRFGILELTTRRATKAAVSESRWLRQLGVEPLGANFTGAYLYAQTRGLSAPIKNVIMDQHRVVGVGNIYASEALFRARVRPTRPASRLKRAEADILTDAIRTVLAEAISAGGSTIRDYRNSLGDSGQYQERFRVYGRDGQPCVTCGYGIKAKTLAGRNTFWCSRCQS